MYEPSFFKRLAKLGLRPLIVSFDTMAGAIAVFAVYILTDGRLPGEVSTDLLLAFMSISAALFAIVLTGLTIITTFTDRYFLYAWQEIGEFENLVTYFQYNLVLPVILILGSLSLHIHYNAIGMILLVGFFVYLVFSLLNLVALVCRYALQRGEFIRQQIDAENMRPEDHNIGLNVEELREIRNQLREESTEKK